MSVGLRMVPMPRDLRFAWEEMPQQMLDEQAQKVRSSLRAALIGWAEGAAAAATIPTTFLCSACTRGALVRGGQPAAQRDAGGAAAPSGPSWPT
jgi:hypothetical protein